MKYFSCSDEKGDFLYTGLNSPTIEECVENMFDYHQSSGDDEIQSLNMPIQEKREILESFGYIFQQHEKIIDLD